MGAGVWTASVFGVGCWSASAFGETGRAGGARRAGVSDGAGVAQPPNTSGSCPGAAAPQAPTPTAPEQPRPPDIRRKLREHLQHPHAAMPDAWHPGLLRHPNIPSTPHPGVGGTRHAAAGPGTESFRAPGMRHPAPAPAPNRSGHPACRTWPPAPRHPLHPAWDTRHTDTPRPVSPSPVPIHPCHDLHNAAYAPSAATSSSWLPSSLMRPFSTTAMTSASWAVCRRWAMATTVRPSRTRARERSR